MAEDNADALTPVTIAKVFEIVLAIAGGGGKDAFLAECAENGHHVLVPPATRAFTVAYLNRRAADREMSTFSVQTGGCSE